MKEWFTAQELVMTPGVPDSVQGIHSMAKRQNFLSRKRAKAPGIFKPPIEYHWNSFPTITKRYIVQTGLFLQSSAASCAEPIQAGTPLGAIIGIPHPPRKGGKR